MTDDTTPPPPATEPADAAPGTILLVDDEPAVRRLASVVLRRDGFTVVEAGGGLEALSLFDTRRADIVAVVIDFSMPDMMGDALAAALAERGATCPVVLVTGFGRPDLASPEAEALIRTFLAKPFTAAELRDAVRTAIAG